MKQTICYLYEYENYKQTRNVGFVKCIFHKDKVTFQIHGKGLDCDKSMDLEMFLFTNNEETYDLDRAGNVEGNQGVVNYMVTIEAMDSNRFYLYDGVLLESVSRKQYVASWKKKEISLKRKHIEYEIETVDVVETITEDIEIESVDVVDEVIEEITEEVKSSEITYEKIDRHGISSLPQREWKWASNQFLLHGYNNYKHLMLIREEGKLFLGIPGIYHRKEETAAKSFGFPMFHPIDDSVKSMIDIQWNEGDSFGYWCRPVTERKGVEERYDRYEYAR